MGVEGPPPPYATDPRPETDFFLQGGLSFLFLRF